MTTNEPDLVAGRLATSAAIADLKDRFLRAGVDLDEIDEASLQEAVQLSTREKAADMLGAVLEWELDPAHNRLVSMSEVITTSDPTWLVRDLVPGQGLGQLVGPTGSFKSFIAIDLVNSVANGLPTWAGDLPIDLHGPAVYVAMEGAWDLGRRAEAWLATNSGTTVDDVHVLLERNLDIGSERSVARLGREIRERCESVRLVVIDTQGLAMGGRSEDSATEMNKALGVLKRLVGQFNCFVLLVHHTGWNVDRERGSSAQRQAVDLSILVEESHQLKVQKLKAGPAPGAMYFEMLPSASSLVVEWTTDLGRILGLLADHEPSDLRQEIVDYVTANPGVSKSKVAHAIGGNRSKAFQTIGSMLLSKELTNLRTDTRTSLVVAE